MRVRELDVMRGLAVFLVLLAHRPVLYDLNAVGRGLVIIGWTGVHMFFVMSGFLVTGLLLSEQEKHGEVRLWRFLVRRGLRIYPQFYLLMSLSIIGPWLAGYELPWRQYLAELFFVQNYIQGYWGFTWSLAVEEHFYLLISVAIWAWAIGLRSGWLRPWALPAFLWVVVGVGVFCRWGYYLGGHYEVSRGYVNGYTHFQIDALAAGALLSWHVRKRGWLLPWIGKNLRWPITIIAAALLAPLTVQSRGLPFVFVWGFPMATVAFLFLHLVALYNELPSTGWLGRAIQRPADGLAVVGRHCYGAYLWQVPVGYLVMPWVTKWLGPPPLLDLAIFCTVSIAVGIATGWLVEVPSMRLRERIAPSRSGLLAADVRELQAQPADSLEVGVGGEAAVGGAGGIRTRE